MPLARITQTVRAILLATAVTTTLMWRSCSNHTIQLHGALRPPMALAPLMGKVRKYLSPRLEMPSCLVLPPVPT